MVNHTPGGKPIEASMFSPFHRETRLLSLMPRWDVILWPMIGIFVGAFDGVVWAFVLAGGNSAALHYATAIGAITGAICGSLDALGVLAICVIRDDHRDPNFGFLTIGTVIGAVVGWAMGYFLASTSPFAATLDECGLLLGTIVGLWLCVTIELFGSQRQYDRRLRFHLAAAFKFVLLIGLTLVLLRLLFNWYLY